MTKMEFGVFEEGRWNFFESIEPVDAYEQTIREVQLEERLGFNYHFVIEHQSHSGGQWTSPAVYLAALAQHTSTIRIGGMIFLVPFYNPMRLAQDVATVDQLSRGRVEFGAGAGVGQLEFKRWKLPFHERRAMVQEALEIIEKAWTEESVTYEGKYWQFDEVLPLPRPYQKPHPPIWFAGRTPASLEYAAAHNYNLGQFLMPAPDIADGVKQWRRLWKNAGHKGPMPHVFLTRAVYVADSDKQAREEIAPYLVQAYTYGDDRIKRTRIAQQQTNVFGPGDSPEGLASGKMFAGMASSLDFWLEHGLAYVGSPETVIDSLERERKLINFDLFGGRFRFGDMPDEMVERSIRLFGEKVIPAFS